MIRIAPSLLSADFANLGRDVTAMCTAGADMLHVDVMDGHFVPNLTFGAGVVRAIKPYSSVPLDVHLMVDNPEGMIEEFVAAGADQLTLHIETGKDITPLLSKIKAAGVRAGVSLKPSTPAARLEEYLPYIDFVLVMTVEPGFGGQPFLPSQLTKIARIRLMTSTHPIDIQVDGGITDKTAPLCLENGANTLISGNYIFKSADWAQAIRALKGDK